MINKNGYLVLVSFIVSGLAFLYASSNALASIAIVGALDSGTETGNGITHSLSAKLGFGGGVLIDHPLGEGAAFEFGALYLTRKFDDTTVGETATENMIQIPVLLRLHLVPMISIGAGGYWETGMGNVTDVGDGTGATVSGSYNSVGAKQSDLGLVGSLRLHFPMGPGVHFLVDGRYTYGLTNISNLAGGNVTYKDYQVLAGFSFGFSGGR